MTKWRCPAIDRGVTVYDDGVIRPCCVIDWSYSKPITEIKNPKRFADLGTKPDVCRKCIQQEESGVPSRRQRMLNLEKTKLNSRSTIQYVDLRNTNLCNARCQFCGPHHSNQFPGAKLRKQSIDDYIEDIITDDLIEIYFAGGEPLISADHAEIIKILIERGYHKNISLRYSTNLSVLSYKDMNFVELWKQFREVLIMPSADGIGETYEIIRQGLNWNKFESNLKILLENKITFRILFVLNKLNIWKLKETIEHFKKNNYAFNIEVLYGPEEFKLNTIQDKIKAEQEIRSCNLTPSQTEYIIKHLYE